MMLFSCCQKTVSRRRGGRAGGLCIIHAVWRMGRNGSVQSILFQLLHQSHALNCLLGDYEWLLIHRRLQITPWQISKLAINKAYVPVQYLTMELQGRHWGQGWADRGDGSAPSLRRIETLCLLSSDLLSTPWFASPDNHEPHHSYFSCHL